MFMQELALVEETFGNSEAARELYKFAEKMDKQKSFIKRRMFKSRKKELQANGLLPKSKAPNQPRIRTSRKRYMADDSSRLKGSNVGKWESQSADVYSVATSGSSDR